MSAARAYVARLLTRAEKLGEIYGSYWFCLGGLLPPVDEQQAARAILKVLPTVRTWANALSEHDRQRLVMALHLASQTQFLSDAVKGQHALAVRGLRNKKNLSRSDWGRSTYNHAQIIAVAQRLLAAGVKPRYLVSRVHGELQAAKKMGDVPGPRQIRNILKKAGVLKIKK